MKTCSRAVQPLCTCQQCLTLGCSSSHSTGKQGDVAGPMRRPAEELMQGFGMTEPGLSDGLGYPYFIFWIFFQLHCVFFWDQWVEMPICFKTHTFCEYTHWFNDVFSLLFYLLTALNNFFAYSFLWYFVKLCLFDCWWALSCVFISDNSGILSLSSSSSFRVVLPFGHYIAFYLHQVISAVLAPHCVVSWGPFAVLCNQV